MVTFFQWLWCSWLAYRLAVRGQKHQGIGYVCLSHHGIPNVAIFIGVGREAWRVSQIAVECHDVRTVL